MEESWALKRARDALAEAEAALVAYSGSAEPDPYRYANLRTARELAASVYQLVVDDERRLT